MVENWFKISCKCGAVNWIFDGDSTDETRPDVLGFICHKCGVAYSFLEDDPTLIEVLGGDDPEDYELGLEKPVL